jgi:uncharacterized protein (TIGR03083 family)
MSTALGTRRADQHRVERVTRDDLLRRIRADRDRFDAIVSRVPPDRLADPVLRGGWSVKDVLAHIAWGEREGIGVARARALVGSELWERSEDARNEAVVRASRSLDGDEVLAEYEAAYSAYLAALEELSDEELNDPSLFRDMSERIPGWLPWRVLYDPGHYAEHGQTIEEALPSLHGQGARANPSADPRRRPTEPTGRHRPSRPPR